MCKNVKMCNYKRISTYCNNVCIYTRFLLPLNADSYKIYKLSSLLISSKLFKIIPICSCLYAYLFDWTIPTNYRKYPDGK